jgi:hypothetical protein
MTISQGFHSATIAGSILMPGGMSLKALAVSLGDDADERSAIEVIHDELGAAILARLLR